MTDSEYVTRRTLLKTAGATTVVGGSAVGTASADSIRPGSCYRTTAKIGTYERACPNEDVGAFYPEGTQGYVWNTCTGDDREQMVDFVPYDNSLPRAWAPAKWLERC